MAPAVIIALLNLCQLGLRQLNFFFGTVARHVIKREAPLVLQKSDQAGVFSIEDSADSAERFTEFVNVGNFSQLNTPVQPGFIDPADVV